MSEGNAVKLSLYLKVIESELLKIAIATGQEDKAVKYIKSTEGF